MVSPVSYKTSFSTSDLGLSKGYSYGFNGMEKDDEHTQGKYDFGARIYDSRIGNFLSVDPEYNVFAFQSPYVFASDNPIFYIDDNGTHRITYYTTITDDGTAFYKVINRNNETEVDMVAITSSQGGIGGWIPRYTNPVTFVTLDKRTNITPEENKSGTREGTAEEGETISFSEYVNQVFTYSGMGSEMLGGVSWTSKKGEGGEFLPKSQANDTEVINIDDMLAPGAGAKIRGINKIWKALQYTKDVLGGLDNGKKIVEAIEEITKAVKKATAGGKANSPVVKPKVVCEYGGHSDSTSIDDAHGKDTYDNLIEEAEKKAETTKTEIVE